MNKKFLIAAAVICVVAIAAMIVALSIMPTLSIMPKNEQKKPAEFTPPPFEAAAQQGMPTVDDPSWNKIFQSGMSFVAYMCGKVTINNGATDVYFTNDASNNAWLKLRIMDENEQILAETGLIKPGEYVKTVKFTTVPQNGQKLTMKIMGYEPETYHSIGAVKLNTVAG